MRKTVRDVLIEARALLARRGGWVSRSLREEQGRKGCCVKGR